PAELLGPLRVDSERAEEPTKGHQAPYARHALVGGTWPHAARVRTSHTSSLFLEAMPPVPSCPQTNHDAPSGCFACVFVGFFSQATAAHAKPFLQGPFCDIGAPRVSVQRAWWREIQAETCIAKDGKRREDPS